MINCAWSKNWWELWGHCERNICSSWSQWDHKMFILGLTNSGKSNWEQKTGWEEEYKEIVKMSFGSYPAYNESQHRDKAHNAALVLCKVWNEWSVRPVGTDMSNVHSKLYVKEFSISSEWLSVSYYQVVGFSKNISKRFLSFNIRKKKLA